MSKSPTSEFESSAGVLMIKVPAGSFIMGNPESEDGHRVWEQQREVTFAGEFYLGKTPVTQAQYEAVTGTNPTDHERIPDAPMDSVNWEQAKEYCQQLTQRDLEAGLLEGTTPRACLIANHLQRITACAHHGGGSAPVNGDPR